MATSSTCAKEYSASDSVAFAVASNSEPNAPSPDNGVTKTTVGLMEDKRQDDDNSESDYDEDKYRLEVNPEKAPKQPSEKRRLDDAAYHRWLDDRQSWEQEAAFRNAAEVPDAIGDSTKLMMLGSTQSIICSPREYQTALFERSKEKNIIVVLGTGSGKTLIAAMLMRHILDNEVENRSMGNPPKVAFFITEKVALCDQQHRVLKNNMSHPIGKLHGDVQGLSSTQEFWNSRMEECMGITCTAQILLDGLNHGFINMRQINLLVFDEAHHAKKNHPFAVIVETFYLGEPNEKHRPRILGMTASPVHSRTSDMKFACSQLESLLHSQIATVPDEVLQKSLEEKRLIESVEKYPTLRDPEEVQTPLWTKINGQVSQNLQVRPALAFAKEAASTLGPWCADRFWLLLLTDAEITRLRAKAEDEYGEAAVRYGIHFDEAVSSIQAVRELAKETELAPVSRHSGLLSAKTERLWDILNSEFEQSPGKRCIVFVEKQYTAFSLADLFRQHSMLIPGLRPAFMVGGKGTKSGFGMTLKEQVSALYRFREGEVNCLFATPVAEEGIDIPSCDLVIRFDLYNTVIQYIQSRGRARQRESRYITMIEDENRDHLRRVERAAREATILQQFCSALPEDRKVQDQLADIWAAEAASKTSRANHNVVLTDKQARLGLDNSLAVLARFVSSLSTSLGNCSPEFVVIPVGSRFLADVILPDRSPVTRVSGFPQKSKQMARSSAAFEVCKRLLENGHIDGHLQSTLVRILPKMRSARLAVSLKKKKDYKMKVKPDIWSQVGGDIPLVLWPTILALEEPARAGRPTRPLIMLTRQRLPELPPIPLFFGDGGYSMARPTSTLNPLELTESQVEGLRLFTLKLFKDVFSKKYEASSSDLPYFLAPERESHESVLESSLATIDWDTVNLMKNTDVLDWENMPDDFYRDKFVVDHYDGSRKLVLLGVNKKLKPSDPAPADAPTPRAREFRFSEKKITDYSTSLWQRAKKQHVWRQDQPVVDAELLPLRRNFLDQFFTISDANTRCSIILEPLQISPIPLDTVFMALIFPSILHRIDSVLIACDACRLLGLQVEPRLALEALTKDADNSDDHLAEQINFQTGMGRNYERLEFLGDTFLKMATTISIFTLKPNNDEFTYHVERMVLLCNRNLFNHAVDRNLQEYIRSKSFDRRSWYPNLKLLKGKAVQSEMGHNLADKSIADVCEALIGAAYMTSKNGNMDMAVKAVAKMVRSKNHLMTKFQDYYANFKVPAWHSPQQTSATLEQAAESVGDKVGYRFKSASLVFSATKHPSWHSRSEIPNYQQLEFLGDALLDMAVVDFLYRRFPEADPQQLTEYKMVMVSNQFLGFLCVRLGLHRHLRFFNQQLLGQIDSYVNELEVARQATNRDATDDSDERVEYWLNVAAAPKALPDIVESIIGAMFVDSGYDYSVVRNFAEERVLPYFADMAKYSNFATRHPVTVLSHRLNNDFECSNWRFYCDTVPCNVDEGVKAVTGSEPLCALMIHQKVIADATGINMRTARAVVAKKASAVFAKMDRVEFRSQYGCNCKQESSGT